MLRPLLLVLLALPANGCVVSLHSISDKADERKPVEPFVGTWVCGDLHLRIEPHANEGDPPGFLATVLHSPTWGHVVPGQKIEPETVARLSGFVVEIGGTSYVDGCVLRPLDEAAEVSPIVWMTMVRPHVIARIDVAENEDEFEVTFLSGDKVSEFARKRSDRLPAILPPESEDEANEVERLGAIVVTASTAQWRAVLAAEDADVWMDPMTFERTDGEAFDEMARKFRSRVEKAGKRRDADATTIPLLDPRLFLKERPKTSP